MYVYVYKCRRCGAVEYKKPHPVKNVDELREIWHICNAASKNMGLCDLIGYDEIEIASDDDSGVLGVEGDSA